MALYTLLGEEELAAALRAFGLPAPDQVRAEPRGGINTNYHVWSGGRRYFLRVNEGKTDADVLFEAEVLRLLAEARYPVPPWLPAADGRAFATIAGRQAVLFAYAPGEEAAEVTPERCRRIGEQLARLHDLAGAFSLERANPYGREQVERWVAALRPGGAGDREIEAALPLLEREVSHAAALPGAPRGLVHGDLFVDNVLWIGDRVSAILDWEMACVDPFAYDLGVALSAWCWADGFDRARASALVAGYRGRRRAEPETLDALYPWARFAALRFTASRIHGYRLAALGSDRLVRKDWRRYRDRLAALVEMGEGGFRALLGG